MVTLMMECGKGAECVPSQMFEANIEYWPIRVTNEEIGVHIRRRRWRELIGHIIIMNADEHQNDIHTWMPKGRRRKRRPRETLQENGRERNNSVGFQNWCDTVIACCQRLEWTEEDTGPPLAKRKWWFWGKGVTKKAILSSLTCSESLIFKPFIHHRIVDKHITIIQIHKVW